GHCVGHYRRLPLFFSNLGKTDADQIKVFSRRGLSIGDYNTILVELLMMKVNGNLIKGYQQIHTALAAVYRLIRQAQPHEVVTTTDPGHIVLLSKEIPAFFGYCSNQ